MLTKVQRNLEKLNIGTSDQKELLIAAVSGGADSVCLLLLLKELEKKMNYELEAIHIEHGIRGEESCRDAEFVENLCQKLLVPYHVVAVDVPAYSHSFGIGTEEAARILRYQAFSQYACERNGKVVLAHHMEDHAETVLFQMLRGSSLQGLCGISSIRKDENNVTYLRPLLDIRRSEIEAYLKQVGQSYCTDSTNQEIAYRRNYLRKEIIPRLSEINSAAVPHISQTAERLGEIRDFLMEETQKAMEALLQKEEEALFLPVSGLMNLHPALRKEIIYETVSRIAGSKKDISAFHVEAVLTLLASQSGKQVDLPYEVVVKRSFDILKFQKRKMAVAEKKGIFVTEEMLTLWKEKGQSVELELGADGEKLIFKVFSFGGDFAEIPKKSCTKWMDYDKIKGGFCIRTRENGDFFINDVNGHRKKLKNYLIDEKIPLEKRNTMWLLAQEALVLWLVGGRISQNIKVTEQTKTVIEIQYIGGK